METTENREATLVCIASACGATGAYLAAQPIPDIIKVPVCSILGVISIAILAFWKAKVNKQ